MNITEAQPQRIPEILAPAGGMPQFFAALNAGADAVYLGLKQFNARARAANFSLEELRSIAPIARAHRMKILVTLNVLIKQTELKELIELLIQLQTADVHAVIVQDLALVKLISQYFPDIRIHASTQMAIHNPSGVVQAAEWGIKRAVLARELSAQELRLIRAAVPRESVELEAFCHGSLCYSYSGLCFFSGVGDSRSGNRGECAYTCREPYKILNEPGHGFLFSMGDLDTSDAVGKFVDAGIDTLKIEGRKKDAQYVSAVVRLYRKKLDDHFGFCTLRPEAPAQAQKLPEENKIRDDLAYSFQRKTTSFFFKGRYHENVIDLSNPTHLGTLAGQASAVQDGWLTFHTKVPLALHDGLKIVAPSGFSPDQRYDNREIQFGISEMKVGGKRVFEADTEALVSIRLPDDLAKIQKGAEIRKVRSIKLKEATESLSRAPTRLVDRQYLSLKVQSEVFLTDQPTLMVTFTAKIGALDIHSSVFKVTDFMLAERRGLDQLIVEHFSILGEVGIQFVDFEWQGELAYAVAPKLLKEFKRDFADALSTNLKLWQDSRAQHIDRQISQVTPALPHSTPLILVVKLDRLDYLPLLTASHLGGEGIAEVVFEPKRSFLGSLSIDEVCEQLVSFHSMTGIKLRMAVPSIVRLWDEALLKRWLVGFAARGFSSFEVGNVGGLQLLRQWDLPTDDVSGDFSCYALNHQAAEFLADAGLKRVALSIEDDRSNLDLLLDFWPKAIEPQLIVYKDSPLFIAEACSLTALHGGCPTAKVCGYRTLEIENSRKERFFVAHESCRSIVYADKAYSITHDWQQMRNAEKIRSVRIDFLTRPYDSSAISTLMRAASQRLPTVKTHAGNYHGRLL